MNRASTFALLGARTSAIAAAGSSNAGDTLAGTGSSSGASGDVIGPSALSPCGSGIDATLIMGAAVDPAVQQPFAAPLESLALLGADRRADGHPLRLFVRGDRATGSGFLVGEPCDAAAPSDRALGILETLANRP